MARVKPTLTPVQVEAEKARAAIEAAREKAKKSGAANDKQAVKNLLVAAAPKFKAENRERFKRVMGTRLSAALDAISSCAKVTTRASYEFGKADFDLVLTKLDEAKDKASKAFEAALASPVPESGTEQSGIVFPD